MYIPREERPKHRGLIKKLDGILDALTEYVEFRRPIPPEMQQAIIDVTGATDPERQFEAVTYLMESVEREYHERLLDSAQKDLTAFGEYMYPENAPSQVHYFVADHLMAIEARDIIRLMLSMPPGHAKSYWSSHLFPAWYIGKHPYHKYIQGGHTQKFCEDKLSKPCRNIVDSDRYRNVFPEVVLSRSSNAAGFWALANGRGEYVTKGVGQGISGYRANCAGLDDPFASREDAESQATRDKVYDWYTADLIKRLLPGSPFLLVATRWHTDDLCGRIERKFKEDKEKGFGYEWHIINLPAISEGYDDPLGRPPGEALWPEFFSIQELLLIKNDSTSRDWNSLYMGKPLDVEGGVIKGSEIHRYTELPADEYDLAGNLKVKNVRRVVVSVDTASKATDRAAYTAATVWVQGVDGKHYLKRVERRRVEFNEMVHFIEDLAREEHASAILIEDRGSGTQYIQTRSGLAPAPVIPITVNNESKEFRFDGVTPMFESGDVLLPEKAPWLADYEAELFSFPNGKYKDQVDSTSQYLAWARTKRRLGSKKLNARILPVHEEAVAL